MSWYDNLNYGQGAAGAVGGAAAGTAIMPGYGTAAGALLGGALGLFSGGKEQGNDKEQRKMLMDYYRNVNSRQPIQLAPTQYGQLSDVRQRQLSLADQLDAISRGQGPSLAEQQLRSATDRNVAQQASFANSGRGGPLGAARAMNNSARLGAMVGQDAASARIAEANQARQLLGLNLHGIRGADESMSQFNAGQGNQASQAQMWATLKQQGMTDEAAMNAIRAMMGQNTEVNSRTGTGDAILAGGANAYAQYLGNRPQPQQSGGGGGYYGGNTGMGDNLLNPYAH